MFHQSVPGARFWVASFPHTRDPKFFLSMDEDLGVWNNKAEMLAFREGLKDLPLEYLLRWVKLCDCKWRKYFIKKEIERRFDEECLGGYENAAES